MTTPITDATWDQAVELLVEVQRAVHSVLGPDYEPQGLAADVAAALHSRGVAGLVEGYQGALHVLDGQIQQAERYRADNVVNALNQARTTISDMRTRAVASLQENR